MAVEAPTLEAPVEIYAPQVVRVAEEPAPEKIPQEPPQAPRNPLLEMTPERARSIDAWYARKQAEMARLVEVVNIENISYPNGYKGLDTTWVLLDSDDRRFEFRSHRHKVPEPSPSKGVGGDCWEVDPLKGTRSPMKQATFNIIRGDHPDIMELTIKHKRGN